MNSSNCMNWVLGLKRRSCIFNALACIHINCLVIVKWKGAILWLTTNCGPLHWFWKPFDRRRTPISPTIDYNVEFLPFIAAFIGFGAQAKLVRFVSAWVSTIHTIHFSFNLGDTIGTQGRCGDYTAIWWPYFRSVGAQYTWQTDPLTLITRNATPLEPNLAFSS